LKVGGQPGHKGVTLRQVINPDQIVTHTPDTCPKCNSPLHNSPFIRFHRRQVFDIHDGKIHVTEHRVEVIRCPICRTRTKASFPSNVKAPVQYGPGVTSRSLYLHLYQLIPVERTCEAMLDLFGCSISAATITRAVKECSDKLVRCEQRIKAAIRSSSVIGVDETGIRISGTHYWVHVARTDTLTHYACHTHRGKVAIDHIGIIPAFRGTLVRDGWFSYKWYQQCLHSLCNAHILEEAYPKQKRWTSPFAKLLVDIKDELAAARTSTKVHITSDKQETFYRRYDDLIERASKSIRGSPQFYTQFSPRTLVHKLQTNRNDILRFMTDPAVPFDNNGSERDLRMLKLQQKIAGCFRTSDGANAFCRIRSYLSSARKQGFPLLSSLQRSLNGKPLPVASTT
jgi:transposase